MDGLLVFFTSCARIPARLTPDNEEVTDYNVIGPRFLPGVDAYDMKLPSSTWSRFPTHCWIFTDTCSGQRGDTRTFDCIVMARERDASIDDVRRSHLLIMIVTTDENGISRRVNGPIWEVDDATWGSLEPSW